MKRQTVIEAGAFLALVIVGVAVRLACQDIPNFAPVAATALFAGYFFRSAWLAAGVPISIMAISDLAIGGYDWRVMIVVYGMLAFPICLRGIARRHLAIERNGLWATGRNVVGLTICSLATSLAFFLATNFAVWCCSGYYEHSLNGLGVCFARALPFFRFTLASDALFGVLLFGGYAAAARLFAVRQPVACVS